MLVIKDQEGRLHFKFDHIFISKSARSENRWVIIMHCDGEVYRLAEYLRKAQAEANLKKIEDAILYEQNLVRLDVWNIDLYTDKD